MTRNIRKVVSIVCAVALLLSLCTVSLISSSSAAGGLENTAQYTEVVNYDFNNATGIGHVRYVDEVKYQDGAVYVKNNSNGGALYFAANPNDGATFTKDNYAANYDLLKLEVGTKYAISFKYKYLAGTTDTGFSIFYAKNPDAAINGHGSVADSDLQTKINSVSIDNPLTEDTDWFHYEYTFTATSADHCYGIKPAQPNKTGHNDIFLIDDVKIVKTQEQTYTFVDNGNVTTTTSEAGAALPTITNSTFLGWYDSTLTVKYTVVPATCNVLFAKYSKISTDFSNDDFVYDPNDKYQIGIFATVADPTDASNKVLMGDATKNYRYYLGLAGALGAKGGYSITMGQAYTVSFRYYLDSAAGNKGEISFYTGADEGIGFNTPDNKAALDWAVTLDKTKEWTKVSQNFVLPVDSDIDLSQLPNLLLSFICPDGDAEIYLDNFSIAPYVAPISTEDFTMNFENNFKWVDGDVANINNYTVSSGNGYVSRGELITENNNTFFRVKHFLKRNSYIYFTVNNGSEQFKLLNTGIYTIEFDYKVEHSETPTTVGLAFVKPTNATTGAKFHKFVEFASFENRNDEEWVHVTYSFGADLNEYTDCTSLAFYVHNTTNVPEEDDLGNKTASVVSFDNIVVHTHAGYADQGMVVFDSKGGSACTSIVATAGEPVGTLPEPTKYGFVFQGWKYIDHYDEDGNPVVADFTSKTILPSYITNVYADWKTADGIVAFTIRTNVESYDSALGDLVARPGEAIYGFPTVAPTATGQKFLGWYYDTAFTKPVDPSKAADQSGTIYAKWESTGTVVDFENYPTAWFNAKTGQGNLAQLSDRFSLEKLENGNTALLYDFSKASNKGNTSDIASAILHTGTDYITAVPGMQYTITFKYKVVEAAAKGQFGVVICSKGNTWGNRSAIGERVDLTDPSDNWMQASITFTAKVTGTSDNNYISFGVSNNCKVYIDDVVVTSNFNNMNVYGSAVVFNTNGGKELTPISGDPGTRIDLPTPSKAGYKFLGWYTDAYLTTPVGENAVYGDELMTLYAKWQLGKYTENFEDYPASVKNAGISNGYSFYSASTAGFDKANVRGGETSLFRNGTSAGIKNFTTARDKEYALTVGETYTLSFYVKPTSVTNAAGTISMITMKTYTGINSATSSTVVAKVGDLKQGEWNLVTYTFTATEEYVGIQTTDGNDMYFDDISVTLKGYTGSATTGDSSINPIVVLAIVVVCAGALLVTGKKIFSK